ncbi:transporter substrate-binding domain-containing protein [Phyllobacterium sp. UNC302MFCol5.2]|uniref:transporter substrate-binding domain-containing protein n=1 Tax=Phyllobacterium sp. UNC302MFCol5.2 TaxID=1449065 RepID=UPI0004874AF7|nr:transporter substrate-binding domain-containing protein [Phyllobacterium sp. UNC302MFCol5.2]
MKKVRTLITAAIVTLAATGLAYAQNYKVGVAAEPFPPFYAPDSNGHFTGWEIDFINAVCAKEKLECTITPVTWDGIIPALQAKKIDMIVSSMSITNERKKIIDFSNKYYDSPIGILGPKGQSFGVTAADMKGKIVGVPSASTHSAYAKKHFTEAAEIKEYQTVDEALQDLAAGRIDAVLSDRFGLDDFTKTSSGACCELKGEVPTDPDVYGPGVGVGLRQEDTALKAKINEGIKAIRTDGTYDQITKKYFPFNIYKE